MTETSADMLLMTTLTVTQMTEMLPRQLVQQPGVDGVMLPDYSGCQRMTSDGDVLKQMLTVACNNERTGLYNVPVFTTTSKKHLNHIARL